MKHDIKNDIHFVGMLLPDHYEVKESKTTGSIHCESPVGLRIGIDGEDEERWEKFMKNIKWYFGERLQAVFHNTCAWHVDFTIYLKHTSHDKP